MEVRALDHVALWVADRAAIVKRLLELTTIHVIDETDRFTLLGADARRGKLTLFDADGPREPSALKHIALRASDADDSDHDLGEGLTLRLVRAATDLEYDLDSVALWSPSPAETAAAYRPLGFDEAPAVDGVPRVAIDGKYVEFHRGEVTEGERPLLNHVAVLVDRAEGAKELGAEVADVVDGPNTYAVFVWGPDRVKIEYVEHKPTFSLV